jgi:hypothetical protein
MNSLTTYPPRPLTACAQAVNDACDEVMGTVDDVLIQLNDMEAAARAGGVKAARAQVEATIRAARAKLNAIQMTMMKVAVDANAEPNQVQEGATRNGR